MDVNLNVPAIEKLLDYVASGIGSVAGSMLAPWKAKQEARAKLIAADGDAGTLLIQAKAQAEAREMPFWMQEYHLLVETRRPTRYVPMGLDSMY